jgi:crotonobetainyl-CoA:carnitine CoA-transferase CaiB-like acyl-CoA transferase
MGAEIIKIERPKIGDNFRHLRPGTFGVMNRGKTSVTLNLEAPEGRDVLICVARTADILVEG